MTTARQGSATSRDQGQAEARVLVVDDEPAITELIGIALRYEGFAVETAASGWEALARADDFVPDLVVLDIMLPDLPGWDVCRRLRQGRDLPIVFLTARDATEDKVTGLSLGGDDYVTKPFSIEELVARVRAVLRRTRPGDRPGLLEYGDLALDEDAHEVTRQGKPLDLTPTEFNLLRFLVLNAGRVLSKAQILDHVWRYDFAGNDNVVEIYISYLRKKVDALDPPLVHTVRGVGYMLRAPKD